ncbi:HD family phosphohydrolase, partial [bacterium]|nr:HD family phosphohydrolase [bacterium]
ILGVIELINKRKDFQNRIPGTPLKDEVIIPFSRKDQDLLFSLASQAAIALENNRLLKDIKKLFEGFVEASVIAIEARDPTTSGHSERVAAMTVYFAQILDRSIDGPYKDIRFNSTAQTELRYASLLHDFGKVGVREEVLVKAKKLFPYELESLRSRFSLIKKSMESDFYKNSLNYVLEYGVEKYKAIQHSLEANLTNQLYELEELLLFLEGANEPTILEEGNFQRLMSIAARGYLSTGGLEIPFLTDREMHVLSIRKGSLSESERHEIESHVTHTFNFLSKIPWTRDLRRVPEIAFSHHEKLNGRGYPNHLQTPSIPLESRLLTICDIYDALTAKDRPYKRAIPSQKAFDIMFGEVNQGLLEEGLLEIFVKAKVFQVIEEPKFNQGRDLRNR